MKRLLFTILSASLLSLGAAAAPGHGGGPGPGPVPGHGGGGYNPPHNPGHGGGGYPPPYNPGHGGGGYYPPPHHGGGHGGEISCAPEVVSDNIAALDSNLTALSTTAEFANASAFQAQVTRIATLGSDQEKVQAYLSLIGIDASNNEQVANFLGAREAAPEWINSLKQTTDISDLQARRVVDTVNKSLVGELQ